MTGSKLGWAENQMERGDPSLTSRIGYPDLCVLIWPRRRVARLCRIFVEGPLVLVCFV